MSPHQIIDWLSALLDSHVQQLKLADDAGDVVTALHAQVNLMVRFIGIVLVDFVCRKL